MEDKNPLLPALPSLRAAHPFTVWGGTSHHYAQSSSYPRIRKKVSDTIYDALNRLEVTEIVPALRASLFPHKDSEECARQTISVIADYIHPEASDILYKKGIEAVLEFIGTKGTSQKTADYTLRCILATINKGDNRGGYDGDKIIATFDKVIQTPQMQKQEAKRAILSVFPYFLSGKVNCSETGIKNIYAMTLRFIENHSGIISDKDERALIDLVGQSSLPSDTLHALPFETLHTLLAKDLLWESSSRAHAHHLLGARFCLHEEENAFYEQNVRVLSRPNNKLNAKEIIPAIEGLEKNSYNLSHYPQVFSLMPRVFELTRIFQTQALAKATRSLAIHLTNPDHIIHMTEEGNTPLHRRLLSAAFQEAAQAPGNLPHFQQACQRAYSYITAFQGLKHTQIDPTWQQLKTYCAQS